MNSAGLDAILRNVDRITIDTSVMIAFHQRAQSAHQIAAHLFRRIERGEFTCYFSVISMAEVLVRPMRSGPHDEQFMHDFLAGFPNLVIKHVDEQVAQQAASVRVTTGIKPPDSFIIATALLANSGAIVFNDARWQRCQALLPRFRWVYLQTYQ